MKRIFLILFLALATLGCSKESGLTQNIQHPSEAILATDITHAPSVYSLFDVWTFTAEMTASTCQVNSLDRSIQEEWRLTEEGGCSLSDSQTDGTKLINHNDLFKLGKTTCTIDGDNLTLQWQETVFEEAGCSLLMSATTTLAAKENRSKLEGEMIVTPSFSGSCRQEALDQHCSHTITITAEWGRTAGADDGSYQRFVVSPLDNEALRAGLHAFLHPEETDSEQAPPVQVREARVVFPDTTLAARVRQALNLSADATITRNQLAQLDHLIVTQAGIRNLSGIEYATGLRSLDLSKNSLLDNLDPLLTLRQNGGLASGSTLNVIGCDRLRRNRVLDTLRSAGVTIIGP